MMYIYIPNLANNMKKENTLGILTPKFKVTDSVIHPPDLYKQTESKVTKISRKLNTCFEDRTIDRDGLAYIEDHQDWEKFETQGTTPWINPSKSVEWQWLNENMIKGTWIGDYKTGKSFYAIVTGFAYTVSNDKMNSVFSEGHLKLK